MKLSSAATFLAAVAVLPSVVGQTPYMTIPMSPAGYCDPSLPCGTTNSLACPCATTTGSTVPSVGKSGKSTSVSLSASLSGVCGYVPGATNPLPSCCGVDGYLPCWYFSASGVNQYTCNLVAGGSLPACCGFNNLGSFHFPPCGDGSVSGKSGKSTAIVSATTCGNTGGALGPNPPCCGFENYQPCGCTYTVGTAGAAPTNLSSGCCGVPGAPPCPISFSGKSGKGYVSYSGGAQQPGGSGIMPLTMEKLSAEVDGAVEEAVEQMVNIGELNVYESSVNVYKYDDDGEGDVINVVASGVN